VLILSGWTGAVTIFSRTVPENMIAKVLGVLGIISTGFLAFILFTSNPFARQFPVVTEGRDLNPLLERNQGRILEARYQLAATRAKQKNAEALLHTEIRTAHSDLTSAIFTATTLRSETLPSARSAFDAAQNAFQNGKSDYLNVLDAERTLIEVERKLINARQDSQSAATRLESLTAAPLERRLD